MSNSIYTLESFVNFIGVSLSRKSVKEYRHCVKSYFEFLKKKNKSPSSLIKTDILEYVSFLKNKGLSSSFIKTNFWAVKKYYKYLVKHDALDRLTFLDVFDDVDLPKIEFKSQKVYLKTNVEEILTVFKKDTDDIVGFGNYIFLLIMATTGARRAEVSLLKVSDIDFATSHITFYNTKNKKPRSVKMSEYLVSNLLKYIDLRSKKSQDNSDYLFLDKKGYKVSIDAIDSRIREYCKKRNIKISFHPFRRGFATELANARVPIDKISKILGHSSINVTSAHYIYSSDLDEAALSYSLFDDKQNTLKNRIQNTSIILKNGVKNNTLTTDNVLDMLGNINDEVLCLKELLQKPL